MLECTVHGIYIEFHLSRVISNKVFSRYQINVQIGPLASKEMYIYEKILSGLGIYICTSQIVSKGVRSYPRHFLTVR